MFFLYVLPLSLSCVKLGQPRGCLLHLRCSLRSLDLPLSHFHRLFPSLSFNHHHYRLLQSPYSSVHLRLSDIFRGQLQLHISLLNWHGTLQIVDLGRDKTGQTIDNTRNNHKQHQYGITRTSRGINQLQISIARMAQVLPCSGIRRSIACLFWSTTPAKLCWLFRAILRNLTPRNQILRVFIRMTLICSSEQVSEISQRLAGILNVLFCFLPRLDS